MRDLQGCFSASVVAVIYLLVRVWNGVVDCLDRFADFGWIGTG